MGRFVRHLPVRVTSNQPLKIGLYSTEFVICLYQLHPALFQNVFFLSDILCKEKSLFMRSPLSAFEVINHFPRKTARSPTLSVKATPITGYLFLI
jgi:hypothetical protein